MLPGELQAKYGSDPGYQNFLRWIAAGGKHGTLGGKVVNEAAVSHKDMPWGENVYYDAAGNVVSLYRDARPGENSPYGASGTGLSAPEWTPGQLSAMFVPDEYKAKNLAAALGATDGANPNPNAVVNPQAISFASALAKRAGETEEEYYRRIERERGIA